MTTRKICVTISSLITFDQCKGNPKVNNHSLLLSLIGFNIILLGNLLYILPMVMVDVKGDLFLNIKDLINNDDMMLKESVIYAIINVIDWKLYIGSAVQARRRKQEHLSKLRNGKHCNIHLQRAFNKYGESAFKFVVLNRVKDVNNLSHYEQMWINRFDFEKELYNFCPTAGNTTGRIVTEETRKKISKKNKGRKASDETKKKLSEIRKGKKLSKESIIKVIEKKNKKCGKYDRNTGELLEVFQSFKAAADSLKIKKAGDLINCAKGKLKSAHGFIWKYYDKEDLHLNKDYISKPKTNGAKRIAMINSTDNTIIREFSSLTEAASFLNLSTNAISNISNSAKNHKKKAYGYRWKFIEE